MSNEFTRDGDAQPSRAAGHDDRFPLQLEMSRLPNERSHRKSASQRGGRSDAYSLPARYFFHDVSFPILTTFCRRRSSNAVVSNIHADVPRSRDNR